MLCVVGMHHVFGAKFDVSMVRGWRVLVVAETFLRLFQQNLRSEPNVCQVMEHFLIQPKLGDAPEQFKSRYVSTISFS